MVPHISSLSIAIPAELGALVDDATAAMARFDSEAGHEIAAYTAVLLRTEAAASSRIENLTASARAIAEAELLPPSRSNASLIAANTDSMRQAIDRADRIDAAAVLEIHRVLLGHSKPAIAGVLRSEQVWIGGSHVGPHDADFVPPHHDHVADLLDDLCSFIDRDDIPVLMHAALAHAQFETVHPFADGNGRVGRALIHAHLRNKGLTTATTIPVSAGLLTDVNAYFDALTHFRSGDPAAIITCVANSTFAAVDNSRRLVDELRAIRANWTESVKARRGSGTWRVADLLLRMPVTNATRLAEALDISPPNVYRLIEPLIAGGVLTEFTDQKRNQKWRADDVLHALDRFAARAGRRSRT